MSYSLLTACEQGQDGTEFDPDPAHNLYDIHHCCVYSEKLVVMDRGTVRNMYSFIPKLNLRINVASWFYYRNILRCTVS